MQEVSQLQYHPRSISTTAPSSSKQYFNYNIIIIQAAPQLQ
jgi:hypothetical protein